MFTITRGAPDARPLYHDPEPLFCSISGSESHQVHRRTKVAEVRVLGVEQRHAVMREAKPVMNISWKRGSSTTARVRGDVDLVRLYTYICAVGPNSAVLRTAMLVRRTTVDGKWDRKLYWTRAPSTTATVPIYVHDARRWQVDLLSESLKASWLRSGPCSRCSNLV